MLLDPTNWILIENPRDEGDDIDDLQKRAPLWHCENEITNLTIIFRHNLNHLPLFEAKSYQ